MKLPVKAAGETPPEGYKSWQESSQYGDEYPPTEIDNYYYDEGPPVVTYYPPPYDYGYLYAWDPFPFWWGGVWFPGFFILTDFDCVVEVGGGSRFCRRRTFSPQALRNENSLKPYRGPEDEVCYRHKSRDAHTARSLRSNSTRSEDDPGGQDDPDQEDGRA